MPKELDRDQLFNFAKSHRQEYENLLQRFVETPTGPAIRHTLRTLTGVWI